MRPILATLLAPLVAACATTPAARIDPHGLDARDAQVASERYRGRAALRLSPLPGHEADDGSLIALVRGSTFRDGTIDVDVAGSPRPGASPVMKGFIGVMFRVQPDRGAGELVYVRPVNGRSDNQLERNHSAQYCSPPELGWKQLRAQSPGQYESYVDLEPGAWTHLRIEVAGTYARLFVNGARQPTLIVSELKHGDGAGAIALWAHSTTDAHFANLRVTPAGARR